MLDYYLYLYNLLEVLDLLDEITATKPDPFYQRLIKSYYMNYSTRPIDHIDILGRLRYDPNNFFIEYYRALTPFILADEKNEISKILAKIILEIAPQSKRTIKHLSVIYPDMISKDHNPLKMTVQLAISAIKKIESLGSRDTHLTKSKKTLLEILRALTI